jgi:hypothetical protein
MATMKTATDELNLRRAPELGDNVIAPLPLAHPVTVIDGETGEKWWKVEAIVDDRVERGFVSSKFLREPVSPLREKLIEHAVAELLRFNRGKHKEHVDPFFKRVGEYWRELGESLDGRNRTQPWSSAFISFVVRKAGYTAFKFSTAHADYINDSIRKRNANDAAADYWGFRLNEHRPQLGDLVAGWRLQPVTFDTRPNGFFPSHTDVVVEVHRDKVRTIGGNVAHSVSMKSFTLDANGFLRPLSKLFAVMKNNR